MKLTKTHLSLIFAAFSVMVGFAGQSHAGGWDYKIYSGGQCMPFHGSNISKFLIGSFIYNSGPTETVFCPVVRDSSEVPNAPIHGEVVVESRSGSTVTCSLLSYTANGAFLGSDTKSTSSTTPIVLIFSLPAILTDFTSSFTIACTLPTDSFVRSYRVGEAAVTDDE